MSASFNRNAVLRLTIKRPPVMSGTPPTRGLPTVIATGVKAYPWATLSAEVIARTSFERPAELKSTSMLTEVREGDTLVDEADGKEYPVISVDDSPGIGRQVTYTAIVHEPKS